MTFLEFDEFQKELLTEVISMGRTKGKEYAYSEKDRFQNFNELAVQLEIDRLKIAWIYVQKHIFAVTSYINKGKMDSSESIRGRIIDIITYMTLIAGMISEHNDTENSDHD